MRSYSLVILLAFGLNTSALACSYPPMNFERLNSQKPIVITSTNKQSFMSLMPARWAQEQGNFVKKRDAYALAYQINENGQFKQLWGYKNWDSNIGSPYQLGYPELHLSDDGKSVIEIHRAVKNVKAKTAVIIYTNGKKVRSYSAEDLGVKMIVMNSCGFASWASYTSENDRAPSDANIYIKTKADKTWKIDINKGVLSAES